MDHQQARNLSSRLTSSTFEPGAGINLDDACYLNATFIPPSTASSFNSSKQNSNGTHSEMKELSDLDGRSSAASTSNSDTPPDERHIYEQAGILPSAPIQYENANFDTEVCAGISPRRESYYEKRREAMARRPTMARFDCLERPLSIFFYKHGKLVSRHPWIFILLPFFACCALAIGALHAYVVTDAVYLFTPKDAPSKTERAIIHEKWPLHGNNYLPGRSVTQSRECQVIVRTRDGGNILDRPYARAVDTLNRYITEKVVVRFADRQWTFYDLCMRWKLEPCQPNIQVNWISSMYRAGQKISFPTHRIRLEGFTEGGAPIYLASSLGGVKLGRLAHDTPLAPATPNVTDDAFVVGARSWLLVYQLNFQPDNISFVSGLWEKEFEAALLAYEDPYIEFTFFHSQTLTQELKRNADSLVFKFALSFMLLIAFSGLCTMVFLDGLWYFDWVVSKPILSLSGVMSSGLGVAAAIGLLGYCGQRFNQIVYVMPFLVCSIGVDNMFLLVAALRRTDRSLPVDERVGEALADAAISITITALTDALSFGVGAITTIPAVQIFCLYTCAAIVVCFLLQLTMFLGIFILYVRLEEKGRHSVTFQRTVSPIHRRSVGFFSRFLKLGSRPSVDGGIGGGAHKVDKELTLDDGSHDQSGMTIFFRDWYGPILMKPVVKLLVMIWFVQYLAYAIYWCLHIKEGLEPINLLMEDSYAIPHYRALERYYWSYGTEVQIVVNNAPDLTDANERQKLDSMVQVFANCDHAIGSAGVQFWLQEMYHYVEKVQAWNLNVLNQNNAAFYAFADTFFTLHDRWLGDVHWNNATTMDKITAFRFIIGMNKFEKTNDQKGATRMMREIASRYPQYNISTFMPLWLFTDQYMLVLPNTLQNIIIALVFMIVIALLLIPQPVCALWVAIAIASIDVGVVGYMTWWGVSLDAISMITIIMSIGFSVDFSAHITYGYVVCPEPTPERRVRVALGALGWPILQGAASTILGVAILSTVKAYMIKTFFKTVFLVILLGSLHGLVFLPVLLSLFVRGACVTGQLRDNSKRHAVSKASSASSGERVRADARLPKQHRSPQKKAPPGAMRPTVNNVHNVSSSAPGAGQRIRPMPVKLPKVRH